MLGFPLQSQPEISSLYSSNGAELPPKVRGYSILYYIIFIPNKPASSLNQTLRPRSGRSLKVFSSGKKGFLLEWLGVGFLGGRCAVGGYLQGSSVGKERSEWYIYGEAGSRLERGEKAFLVGETEKGERPLQDDGEMDWSGFVGARLG